MPDRRLKPAPSPHPDKTCASCGRTISWRKKWERDWEHVKFCSDRCRADKPGTAGQQIEAAILSLLHARGHGKTICPSEAARAVALGNHPGQPEDPSAWQPLLEPARAAARRLVAAGRILITQHGVAVDASTAKGPIRLQLR